MATKINRQTHTDVAIFALWLNENAQELRDNPRTAETIQNMYNSAKASSVGQVGLPAIKKLSKTLGVPLAKISKRRSEGRNSKRTDRIIKEMRDLSEKLQVLAKHVLALTDDEYLVDGSSVDQFEITEGLKSLVDKKSDPLQKEKEITPPSTETTPSGQRIMFQS